MKTNFIYDAFMAPFESFAGLKECRKHLMPRARGKVLEIGPGTGVNAAHFNRQELESITILSLEPDGEQKLSQVYQPLGEIVSFVTGDVQYLPFADNEFDTVAATLLFCSVVDPLAGLKEIRRVLKPNGEYLFMEHVRPKGKGSALAADFFTPLWKRIAGGCHLNRETEEIINQAGFRIEQHCTYTRGVFIAGAAVKN